MVKARSIQHSRGEALTLNEVYMQNKAILDSGRMKRNRLATVTPINVVKIEKEEIVEKPSFIRRFIKQVDVLFFE